MKKLLLLAGSIFYLHPGYAENITVKNITELLAADKRAKPGDIITLQNGIWENSLIELSHGQHLMKCRRHGSNS